MIKSHIQKLLHMICMILVMSTLVSCKGDDEDDGNNKDTSCYCSDRKGNTCYSPADLGQIHKYCINPKNKEWCYTNLMVPKQSTYSQKPVLSISIEGTWQPWGGGAHSQACNYWGEGNRISNNKNITMSEKHCDPNNAEHAPCLVGKGDRGQPGLKTLDGKIPCSLHKGLGAYGLIINRKNCRNKSCNPTNLGVKVANNPNQYFTFHLGDRTRHGIRYEGNAGEGVDTIYNLEKVNNPKGELYFRVLGNNYLNHSGELTLHIDGGTNIQQGFIAKATEVFENEIRATTARIYEDVVGNSGYVTTVRALLVLYVMLHTVCFVIGIVKTNQKELLTRFIKIGIIVAVISPQSWQFFHSLFLSLFYEGARSISSTVIESASLAGSNFSGTNTAIALSADSPLAIFDQVVSMLTSAAVNNKIWANLFSWRIFWIPIIYIAIVLVMLGIFNALVVYLTAILQGGIMAALTPLFIVMILFKTTFKLFEGWVQQLTSSAFVIIIITAMVTLMYLILKDQLHNLLFYPVCWEKIFDCPILFWPVFWRITDPHLAETALTFQNYFGFLLSALLFHGLIAQVPKIADVLANARLMPSDRAYGHFASALYQGLGQMYNSDLMTTLRAQTIGRVSRATISPIIDKGEALRQKAGAGLKAVGSGVGKVAKGAIIYGNPIGATIGAARGVSKVRGAAKEADGYKALGSKLAGQGRDAAKSMGESVKKGGAAGGRALFSGVKNTLKAAALNNPIGAAYLAYRGLSSDRAKQAYSTTGRGVQKGWRSIKAAPGKVSSGAKASWRGIKSTSGVISSGAKAGWRSIKATPGAISSGAKAGWRGIKATPGAISSGAMSSGVKAGFTRVGGFILNNKLADAAIHRLGIKNARGEAYTAKAVRNDIEVGKQFSRDLGRRIGRFVASPVTTPYRGAKNMALAIKEGRFKEYVRSSGIVTQANKSAGDLQFAVQKAYSRQLKSLPERLRHSTPNPLKNARHRLNKFSAKRGNDPHKKLEEIGRVEQQARADRHLLSETTAKLRGVVSELNVREDRLQELERGIVQGRQNHTDVSPMLDEQATLRTEQLDLINQERLLAAEKQSITEHLQQHEELRDLMCGRLERVIEKELGKEDTDYIAQRDREFEAAVEQQRHELEQIENETVQAKLREEQEVLESKLREDRELLDSIQRQEYERQEMESAEAKVTEQEQLALLERTQLEALQLLETEEASKGTLSDHEKIMQITQENQRLMMEMGTSRRLVAKAYGKNTSKRKREK